VPALEVVEAIDVLADVVSGSSAAFQVIDFFQLAFERREEALGDGVVPAVSAPAHAAFDASGLQGLAVVAARVRAATIGVVDEARARTA
jgi:hypothetical protein